MNTQLAIANAADHRRAGDADVRDGDRRADAARGRRPGPLAPDGRCEHGAGAGRAVVLDHARVRPAAGARSPRLAERGRRWRPASRPRSTSRRRRGTSPRGRRSIRRSCSTWCRTRARRRPACASATCCRTARRRSSAPTRWPRAAAPPSGSIAKIRRWRRPTSPREITSVDGTPIVVERSLYLREAGSTSPRGGDTSTGVTAPATRWFVEGATGRYTMRLLLANPGAEAAQVQARPTSAPTDAR